MTLALLSILTRSTLTNTGLALPGYLEPDAFTAVRQWIRRRGRSAGRRRM